MESGAIADAQVSASSIWSAAYGAYTARLNRVHDEGEWGEWIPANGFYSLILI